MLAVPWSSAFWNLSCFSLSLPELHVKKKTHVAQNCLIQTCGCLSTFLSLMCCFLELWHGGIVTAESQERLCRSSLSWELGSGCIRGRVRRQERYMRDIVWLLPLPQPLEPWGEDTRLSDLAPCCWPDLPTNCLLDLPPAGLAYLYDLPNDELFVCFSNW